MSAVPNNPTVERRANPLPIVASVVMGIVVALQLLLGESTPQRDVLAGVAAFSAFAVALVPALGRSARMLGWVFVAVGLASCAIVLVSYS